MTLKIFDLQMNGFIRPSIGKHCGGISNLVIDRSKPADYENLAERKRIESKSFAYSTDELAGFYDYKIWVETPREIRLQRGIERDGEEMRKLGKCLDARRRYLC